MTFNTFLRTCCALAIISAAHCLQDPAKTAWGEEEEFSTRNKYLSLKMAVQDSTGRFYGYDGGYIVTFDSTTFFRNEAPDSFDIREGVRMMYLDVNGAVILFHSRSASLVRYLGDTLQIDSIHNDDMALDNILPVTNEDGNIWSATDNGYILCWDGTSMTTRARVPIYRGINVVGIFPDSNGLQVFTRTGYRMSRFLVDDSGPVEHELKTDSCQYVRFFRLGGQIYGEGTFGSSFGTWHYRIFTVTSSDSLRLVDTLPGEFGFDFLRTDDAVYMKGYRSVYKFTQKGSKWILFSDEDDFRGPLFLDRFGRASMLYTPTRRIMLIDSLPGM